MSGALFGILISGLFGVGIGFTMFVMSIPNFVQDISLIGINYRTKIYRHANKIVRQKRYKAIVYMESTKYLVQSILGILIGIVMFIGGIMAIVYVVRTRNMQLEEVANQLKLLLCN